MYAMNGLTEGYAKGREDLFKQQRQTFETNVKAMQDRMKVLKDKLDVGIKTIARDKERGELEIQAAMAEANADFLKSQKDTRGVIATREVLENQIKQLDKSLDFLRRSEEKYKAQQLQGYWNQERLNMQERLNAATNDARERIASETAQRQRDLAYLRAELRPAAKEPRSAVEKAREEREIRTLVQGVRGIENLQDQLRKPEVRTGLVAKAAPLLEKLKSLAPGADFETAVNQTLTGTDETTLFLKDALLETYAIESAAKGGQRLTVQDMKMVGPVLDPTNYTPQTYNALLDQRRKVLYDNLQDRGLTPDEIKKASARRPYTPYGGEAPSPSRTLSTEDKEALDWANSHPQDPRSAKIKSRLGV
jgi:hypothetical protein